jgi:hypothetical protein
MAGQTFPDVGDGIFEADFDQARMRQHREHGRTQRTQPQGVARMQQGRLLAVLGRGVKVTGAEDHRCETGHVTGKQRIASGEPHLHHASRRRMFAGQAGGQSGRVVGHHEVAFADERRKARARMMRDRSPFIDDEKPCVHGTLRRDAGRDH